MTVKIVLAIFKYDCALHLHYVIQTRSKKKNVKKCYFSSYLNFLIFFISIFFGYFLTVYRFSFPESCVIRMCDAEFNYTYEYQGNAPKLVHTPLTDKCYLTLTQGMHMGLGGNPYGPAGTGKTESVKALGGLFGRQVLVFNCDEVSYVWYRIQVSVYSFAVYSLATAKFPERVFRRVSEVYGERGERLGTVRIL